MYKYLLCLVDGGAGARLLPTAGEKTGVVDDGPRTVDICTVMPYPLVLRERDPGRSVARWLAGWEHATVNASNAIESRHDAPASPSQIRLACRVDGDGHDCALALLVDQRLASSGWGRELSSGPPSGSL